jgi:hypothetical protein
MRVRRRPGGKGCGIQGQNRETEGEIAPLNAIRAEMMKSENKKISLSDPDARSMATGGKGTQLCVG